MISGQTTGKSRHAAVSKEVPLDCGAEPKTASGGGHHRARPATAQRWEPPTANRTLDRLRPPKQPSSSGNFSAGRHDKETETIVVHKV